MLATRPTRLARRTLLQGLALVAGMGPASRARGQDARFFSIATGGVDGTYFVIGGALADALSSPVGARPCREEDGGCGIPGLIASARSTAGSVANVKGLVSGEFDSGFSQADVAFHAWQADGPFAGMPPATELRTIASLYPETFHIVLRKGVEITSVPELRGKRVALDEPGSGTLFDARLVLAAFGVDETQLQPSYIKGGPALAGLRDGTLDAMVAVGGDPMPVVAEAVERLGGSLLPIVGAPVEQLLRDYPFLIARTIPGDTYVGTPATETIAVGAEWLVTAQLDEELGFQLTRVLFAKRTLRRLAEAHRQGAKISLATALAGLAVPLHPGAERFYKEHGVLRVE